MIIYKNEKSDNKNIIYRIIIKKKIKYYEKKNYGI